MVKVSETNPVKLSETEHLEVLKRILFKKTGKEDIKPLIGKIWCADFKAMRFRTLSLSSRSDCLCSKSERSLPPGKPEELCRVLSQRTWKDYFQSTPRPLLLDIRSAEEYEEYHLPEALWGVPEHKALSKSREIYVYCNLGVSSLKTCQDLISRGYKAFSIKGGLTSYIENERIVII